MEISGKIKSLITKIDNAFIEKYGLKNFNIKTQLKEEIDPTILKDKYLLIDLSTWDKAAKKILFQELLEGIAFYFFIYSNKSSFPFSYYNELKESIAGKNEMYLYKNAVKRVSQSTIINIVLSIKND